MQPALRLPDQPPSVSESYFRWSHGAGGQAQGLGRELRAFFSCMAWRAIPGPLSKRKRRLDSLEAAQGSLSSPCLLMV